tara:strand:- start:396 stop:539 length:144 start_codon:yes stop_codon:yes gene_type:complete
MKKTLLALFFVIGLPSVSKAAACADGKNPDGFTIDTTRIDYTINHID